uniref:Integrase catalytic domain-containing protein n=2 Tax=Clastoptera arizonana TaxID=38151 RepID=A0A1B6EB86_9HEMI
MKNSQLTSLSPFLDQDQVIRVGGRLQQSDLTPDQIHPIVLPKKHRLTELIAIHFHIKTMHAGPQLLLNVIRRKYWPINGKNLVNKIFRQCISCFRINPKRRTQVMGELPRARVQIPSRAFYNCGVDYCGPFVVKISKRRGTAQTSKCYIALFVCFSTKAVHLELVEDLTTESFIAALRRFISRRGKPRNIFSDNGTNFVGACHELRELSELWASEQFGNSVVTASSREGIAWRFQPPSAPHFGGLWESSVKLLKTHLKRCIGKSILTYTQFVTLLTQVEACINSRPLTPLSESPIDLTPLTPSHFLIGDVLTANPEPFLLNTPTNRLNHWQLVQQMLQHFWLRWSRDYLNTLQQRKKWTTASPNPQIGDMVIIKEDNLPPLQWKLARVINVHPGKDSKVRVVSVKTSSGTFKRPITKLCFLPVSDSVENNSIKDSDKL